MTHLVCPECQAALDADRLAQNQNAECSFCGADLPDIDFDIDPADGAAAGDVANSPAAEGLPVESKVQIVESSNTQKVIFVPAGGKRVRGLAVMAVVWNAIVGVISGVMLLVGGAEEIKGLPLLFMIPFLGLFWVVGLGLVFYWIRLRFTRLYLLLERDRLVIQRILFGRKAIKETDLAPNSRARLVEAYQQNDESIYAVAIEGVNRTAKFGTALSREEKDWFVRTINEFISGGKALFDETQFPEQCDACGAELGEVPAIGDELICPICGKTFRAEMGAAGLGEERVADLEPGSISPDNPITVLDSSPDQLRIRYAAVPHGAIRSFAGWFLLLFALVWFGGVFYVGSNAFGGRLDLMDKVSLVFSVVAAIAAVIPFLLGLFVLHGRITIDLTHEWLHCRWHLGPLGYQKRVPAVSVTNVTVQVEWPQTSVEQSSRRSRRGSEDDHPLCYVFAMGKVIPLTILHEEGVVRDVAGLVRNQLRSMGFTLQDA